MEGLPSGDRPRIPAITMTVRGTVARQSGGPPRTTPRVTANRRGGSLPRTAADSTTAAKATEGRRSGGLQISEIKRHSQ